MTNSQQEHLISSIGLPNAQSKVLHQLALAGVGQQQLFSIGVMMSKALLEGDERADLIKWLSQERDRLNSNRWATDPMCLIQHFKRFSLRNIRQGLSDLLYDLSRWLEPKN